MSAGTQPGEQQQTPPPAAAVRGVSGARVAHNTLLNILGQAVPLALAFVAMRYLLPGLGPDRFGILSIAWITVGYFMVVGFGSAATKHIAEVLGANSGRVPALAVTALWLQAAIGLAGGVVLTLFAEPLARALLDVPAGLEAEAIASFRLLGLSVPIVMVSTVYQGVLEAAQRFDLVNAVRVPSMIATFALPLLGLWAGLDLPGIVLLLVAGKAAVLLAYRALARRAVPELRGPVRNARAEWRAILSFGSWASVSSVVSPALHYMDRIGLGMIAGVAAVGWYSAPFEVVTRLRILPGALVMALFPAISALHGAGDRERGVRLAMTSTHMVLLSIGLGALLLIGGAHDLLRLWLGPEAAAIAARATQVLAAGVVVNSLAYVPFVVVQGLGRPDIPARLYLLQLPVQVLLVWLCVTRWGVTGAAIAWGAHVTLDCVLLTNAAARVAGHRARDMFSAGFRRTALLMLVGAALVLAAATTIEDAALRIGAVIATTGAVALVAWSWSLDEAERARLLALARIAPQPKTETR